MALSMMSQKSEENKYNTLFYETKTKLLFTGSVKLEDKKYPN